jgi:hypothetical protein
MNPRKRDRTGTNSNTGSRAEPLSVYKRTLD